jgi:streptogramin lyase
MRRKQPVVFAVATALLVVGAGPSFANGIRVFELADFSTPYGITAGPDGNIWFTEYAAGKIGRISREGLAEFPLTNTPQKIAAGPDGNIWFTEYYSKIGRLTPVTVQLTEFSILTGSPLGITAGPDGNMWYTNSAFIGRITMNGDVTEFQIPDSYGSHLIATGPDGNLWFTAARDFAGDAIGRVTPDGVFTLFPLADDNAYPWGITSGPDGNVWFTEQVGNRIGRITPLGGITEFTIPTPFSLPKEIVSFRGDLAFTELGGGKIGKVSTSGAFEEWTIPHRNPGADGIAVGPVPNTLWFVESSAYNIVAVK